MKPRAKSKHGFLNKWDVVLLCAAVPVSTYLLVGSGDTPRSALSILLAVAIGLACSVLLARRMVRAQSNALRSVETAITQARILDALERAVEPVRSLPPTRGWVASPDFLLHVWEMLQDERPNTIVELGSGVSTIVLGYYAQRNPGVRVISLDHLEEMESGTRRRLIAHGLEQYVELVHAPLTEVRASGRTWKWYDAGRLPAGLSCDFLIVDGPPAVRDVHARAPALPVLEAMLAPRYTAVFDDGARPGETAAVREWARSHPDVEVEFLPTEKGTWIVRRGASPSLAGKQVG